MNGNRRLWMILMLSILCLVPLVASAQTILYSSNFDANNGGLIAVNSPVAGGWAWGAPTSGPGAAHSGANVWATNLSGDYSASADYWLSTPQLTVPVTATICSVTFWSWIRTESGWDGARMRVSTDNGATWNNLPRGAVTPIYNGRLLVAPTDSVWTNTTSFNFWQLFHVDLSAYVGHTIVIQWRFTSDSSGQDAGWYVDDVLITWQTVNLPPVVTVDALPNTFDRTGPYTVTATATDNGTVTGVVLHYIIDGGAEQTATMTNTGGNSWTGTIPAGGPYAANAVIEYWAVATDDGVPPAVGTSTHSSFTIMVRIPPPHCADFEANDDMFTTDDAAVWQWGTPTVGPSAHSGSKLWATVLNGNYPNSANAALYTYPIDLRGATSASMTWWQWYNLETSYDYGYVFIWNGTAWIQTDLVYNGVNETWTEITLNLNQYLGTTIQVAWLLSSDGSFNYEGWYIDDVCLNGVVPPYGTIEGTVSVVGAANNAGVSVTLLETGSTVVTDATGNFEFSFLPAGNYTIRGLMYGYQGVTVPVVPAITATYDTVRVNFSISQLPTGRIYGYATKYGQADHSGLNVTLLGALTTVVTPANGYYSFDNVPIGWNLVSASGTGWQQQTGEGMVPAGDSVRIDFTLFPGFANNFDADNGGLVPTMPAGGTPGWEWGVPDYAAGPDAAHSAPNCWGTNLTGDYNISSDWFLTTSALNLNGMTNPQMTFWHWYAFEQLFDGGNLKISTNGGTSWTLLTPTTGYPLASVSSSNTFISGQPAFSGSNGSWQQVTVSLAAYSTATVLIRWEAASDASINFAGWYVDDVIIGSTPPTGTLNGFVYSSATGLPLSGAWVTCQGESTRTNVIGYYNLPNLVAGWQPATASYPAYFAETRLGNIPPGGTGRLDFNLNIMEVSVTPIRIEITTRYGDDGVGSFTICNGAGGTLDWNIVSADAGFKARRNILSDFGVTLPPLSTTATAGIVDLATQAPAGDHHAFGRPTLDANVIQTIDNNPLGIAMTWGIGADETHYWVSDVNGGAPPTVDHQFNLDGTPSGTFWNMPLSDVGWGADMTYDGNGGLWQLVVGAGMNGLVKLDPATGSVLSRIADPDMHWDRISQRGLAYDQIYDVFFIGGWNTDSIFVVLGPSYGSNQGRVAFAYGANAVSGLAFEPNSRTLFVMANAAGNPLTQVNPWNGTVLNNITFPPAPANTGAGIEFDSRNYLVAASQTENVVYILDVGARPDPVVFSDMGGALDSFMCRTVTVRVAGGDLPPGDYTFTYTVVIPNHAPVTITIVVHVKAEALAGWNMIANPMQIVPDDPRSLLGDDFYPLNLSPYRSDMYGYTEPTDHYYIPTHLTRGVGYYLWTRLPVLYDIPGVAFTTAYTANCTWTPTNMSYPGFNFLGNPFNLTIDWDQVMYNTNTSNMSNWYWYWRPDSGWVAYQAFSPFADPLRFIPPFRGFMTQVADPAAFSGNGVAYFSHPDDYVIIMAKAKEAADASTWRVKISATASTLIDANNYFGTATASLDGLDATDGIEPNPPSTTGWLRASFPHPEWGTPTPNYLQDIKAPLGGVTKEWTFEVVTDMVPTAAHLNWPANGLDGIANIPAAYTVELIDNQTSTVTNMRTNLSYNFTLDHNRTFTVRVSYSVLDVPVVGVVSTSDFVATPNPNSGSATIRFDMPVSGHAELALLNVLGEKVATMLNADLTNGSHSLIFSGKDDQGNKLNPGVYTCRLSANGQVRTENLVVE